MQATRTAFEAGQNPAALAAQLAPQHVADIVEVLNEQPTETASSVLALLPHERAVEVFDQPEFDASAEILQRLPVEQATTLLRGMSEDRAAEVFRQLDEPVRSHLFARLDPETRVSLQQLLSYPPDTAGSLMTTEFVSVPATWTVGQTLQHIREVESTRETVYAIYIIDPMAQTLLRALSLRRLIISDPNADILSVAQAQSPVVASPLMDREEVALLISKYDLLAVPVVDDVGHVLGIVTVDDVIDAMIEESTEEVQRFGGLETIDRPYMEISFKEMIRKRGGWLAVLFMGEMLTASAMQHYEDALSKAVVLTLFIPLIMSSGGNSGSQATSLLIRALALQELRLKDWWRVALRELPTGITLGGILGGIAVLRIALWQNLGFYDYGAHWMLIALTVCAALIGIVTFGSLAGATLPFVMKRLGFDPASASAPFVATLVDVTGLLIYFSIALAFLSGTLL
ncbi:magnesium transporter [Microvirga sp. 2TAF3]|uniref:magnesium transporter n=1 Tax=Microvirga sp. 2TAF3 TaxID=3233014 RepID=UPI003F9C56DF